ncbi:MAG: hypothetical protein WCI60_00640 [bacterium]
MSNNILKQIRTLAGLVSVLLFSVVLFAPSAALAVSTSNFQAGRIIDDDIFFNSATMNTAQIQAFLKAKLPDCDTNGSLSTSYRFVESNRAVNPQDGSGTTVTTTRALYGQRYDAYHGTSYASPPYTCLKSYIQDTPTMPAQSGLCNQYSGGIRSAADIIYRVGVACGINPQVLIVLLQKEQSLVTDTWPWGNQYSSATGFGCPDTAPCDSSFGGYFYQVYYAAHQFKLYQRDAGSFGYKAYRNNKILYSPAGETACGSSTVYIQNQATAGLYNYTPYQPNAATLAALEGQTVNCGAYGNLNFWRTFSNWFGSTIIGQQLSVVYKAQNGNELYAVWDGVKYYIPSYDIMIDWGLHRQAVNIISDQAMADLVTGPQLTNIAKMSDDPASPLFMFDDGKRYPIPENACAYKLDSSPNPETTWGLDCFNTNISKSYPKAFIENTTVQDITLPNMIAYQDSVWKLEGGKKRRIVDGLVVDVLGGWGNVRWMKDSNAQQPEGKILMRNGYAVRFTGSSQVYLYDNGRLYPVNTLETFIGWGLNKNLHDLQSSFNVKDPLPVDSPLGQMGSDGINYYVVDNDYKLPLANDTAQWPTDSAKYTPGMLSQIPSIPLSNVYLSSSSGQIFTVYGKKRYVFPTMNDFFKLGFNTNAIRRVSGQIENMPGLVYGGMHMSNGRLYKINDNPQIYMVNGSSSLRINSINYPGLDYANLITVDPLTGSRYPVSGTYTR